MTSVPQLPLEGPPPQALQKNERLRARANKAAEENNEAGFAAALAQALPGSQLPVKAEQAGHKNPEVEGSGVVAEEAERAAGAHATGAPPPATAETAVKAAAPTFVTDAPPVESLPGAARPEEGGEPVFGSAGADAAAGESLAEPEVADAARQLPTAESTQPESPLTEGPTAKTVPLQAEQVMNGSSTHPQPKDGPPAPRNEGAAEGRSNAASTVAAKTELARVDEPPVIEFQVRRERPARDVGRSRLAAPSDLSRPPAHPVGAASQAGPGDNEAQAERGRSGDATDKRDEPTSALRPEAASVKTFPLGDSDAQKSEPIALKPAAAQAQAAQPVNGLQAAGPANTTPAEPRAAPPAEEARPLAPASPPSETEIAAKLRQQSGRTTLNVVLQDERLGRVALQLVERGGWIETAIRASDPRTAQTLSNGAAGLFEALQQRGLALAGGGAAAWDAHEGQRRENPQRDTDSQRRRFRLRRSSVDFEGALARVEA